VGEWKAFFLRSFRPYRQIAVMHMVVWARLMRNI